ncbi:hypothetical protein ABMZ76_04495 [Morganella morganii]|uniref:hypothetical protein n=1 Tax=Morganella morganii TaxID=582 RepID=UPI003EB94327
MKKTISFLAIMLLVGCATTQVLPESAKLAPQDRVTGLQQKNNDSAKITIVRDSGNTGGACYATVFIDGAPVARLDTGEKAAFYVSPGEKIVGVALDGKGLCSFGGTREERDISVNTGESKYYRISTDAYGNMDIKPTALN